MRTIVQIQGYTDAGAANARLVTWNGTDDSWDFRSSTEHPALKYVGGGCETISSNTPANDGDPNQVDCGDLLPGQ